MALYRNSISIVTPCLNAAGVIRRNLDSVRNNEHADVEHIVVDGGSTDGTQDILRDYPGITCVFGSDDGPYDAINQGFARARGDILAWLNADDFYIDGALDIVAEIFSRFPQYRWLTSAHPLFADASGRIVAAAPSPGFCADQVLHPDLSPPDASPRALMQQESTFWRRDLWEVCGGRLDPAYRLAADLELWLRFQAHAKPLAVNAPLACFRWTDAQRSAAFRADYRREAETAIRAHGGAPASRLRTVCRHAALLCRGLPQTVLKRCPFAREQAIADYSRAGGEWQIRHRYFIPC